MKINREKLKNIALAIGSILGYVTILIGIVMTILILETTFPGNNI